MDASLECATLTSLLGLDEFEVVESQRNAGAKLLRLVLVPRSLLAVCPHCRKATDERHACHDRQVRDLPMGGCAVELIVRQWQFHCDTCGRYFTPRLQSLAEASHATERLLERLSELAGRSDVKTAARFFDLPEKTAQAWYYQYLERKDKPPVAGLMPVQSLGIDELSLKKDAASSVAY